MTTFHPEIIRTPRLAMNVWSRGPTDGTPVLLVHGNISSGGFWKYVAEALPDDVRVIAPDLRGFGDTEPLPVDATRGLRDMADDLYGLLDTLGLTGGRRVHAAGWSMGGGVLEQYLLDDPDDLASLTLLAPMSPYGFAGTKGLDGQPTYPDYAGSGGGLGAPEIVRRMREHDRGADDPQTSPRMMLLGFMGPGANADNVDVEFLVDELLKARIGDDFLPGDVVPSENWPGVAPGTRGVFNAMSPRWFDTSALGRVRDGVPITWIHGTADQVVSDRSMFDFAVLGELGLVPGWPGADVMPSQPMESQTRPVLDRYAAGGGSYEEVVLDGVGHGMMLEVPQRIADEIARRVRRPVPSR
jgi:pimeloyl-ACP methyl ester carboxylesterase